MTIETVVQKKDYFLFFFVTFPFNSTTLQSAKKRAARQFKTSGTKLNKEGKL